LFSESDHHRKINTDRKTIGVIEMEGRLISPTVKKAQVDSVDIVRVAIKGNFNEFWSRALVHCGEYSMKNIREMMS
jgi:hypothetical protein